MSLRSIVQVVIAASLGLYVCGCGGGAESFDVAPVKGKVLCNGQPVTSGTILFAPVAKGEKDSKPGKTGSGSIESDGTFVISTYKEGDGAVIGKHKITAGTDDPAKPWACELTAEIEYDVTSGSHEVVIELLANGTGKIAGGK